MRILYLASTLSFLLSYATAGTTYVVPHKDGQDDTPALTAAFAANPSLAKDSTILFQKGVTYNMLTPLVFPRLDNVTVRIEGNLTYAANVKATQAIVGSSKYPGHWFTFKEGTNVKVLGSQDPNWGWVNSNGQLWWNAMQQVSAQVNRPHGWSFHKITYGEVAYLKFWQPVAWSYDISSCSQVHFHHNTIIAISENKSIRPYNTDGFDVKGTNLLFDNNVVYNNDDCVAIGSPASGLVFRDSYCNGGHGLSIGSLGKGGSVADVKDILFENIVMENSWIAARFKSYTGGKGIAKNITWRDITLKKVRLPIVIYQNYWNKNDGAQKYSSAETSTSVQDFTFENFQGSIDDSTTNGMDGATGKEVIVFNMFKGTCSGILAKGITTKTLSGAGVAVMCDPKVTPDDMGFKCWNGLYQPTAAGE